MTHAYVEWKAWQPEDFGKFGVEAARYYAEELRASGLLSVNGLTVAELGYGNGAFAGWVRDSGGHWVGREAIPELADRARDAGFEVLASDAVFPNGSGAGTIDLIVAFDVVEHLDLNAIRSFLTEAKEALRPGGLLLLRIPSGDSPFSSAVYRGDLTHRTLLGSNAVRQLAAETGLHVSQIRPPTLPVGGHGLIRGIRRAIVRSVQAMVYGFIRTVLMGNEGAVVSPNMIVVLKRSKPGL